jgi:hypothetical protein
MRKPRQAYRFGVKQHQPGRSRASEAAQPCKSWSIDCLPIMTIEACCSRVENTGVLIPPTLIYGSYPYIRLLPLTSITSRQNNRVLLLHTPLFYFILKREKKDLPLIANPGLKALTIRLKLWNVHRCLRKAMCMNSGTMSCCGAPCSYGHRLKPSRTRHGITVTTGWLPYKCWTSWKVS